MAEVVASGILNSLRDRLTGRMVEEFGWLTGVGAELKKLMGTLSTIRDVLEDAEARQVKGKALTSWLRRLKDVAYDIDDLLDEDFAKNRKRSAPESSTSSIKGKVSNLLSLPNSVFSQLKISREIREIRESLDELAKERSSFHLRERSAVTCGGQEDGVREGTGTFVIESEVFGREEDKKKIIEFLVDTSGGVVIAIVGMGGVGKTTLAKLVYNDQQISDHFEKKIWVRVSDDFDPKSLVRLIIEKTTRSPCNLTSMALMESMLKQELEKKRFLLVLDDVWNENDQKWERLRSLLTIGAAGSKVIVTARDGRIASVMATVETHFLKVLSNDHCWLLFEKRAFGIGACEKTTNLATIGKEIVEKCGGVPLAVKILGSLMRSKRRESEWSAVLNNDSWKLEENGILPALRLSYNQLPSHLKQCFSYCSMFPKDAEIEDATLIELWIAEGFVRPPNKNVKLEDVGYQYLQELLSRSLFERPVDAWMSSIKIHDLVHDLARSTSGKECSSIDIASNKRDIYPTTRYSSFTYTKEATPSILEILKEAKKLRTFYFIKSYGGLWIEREDMMLKILETVFSSMKLLRSLYLNSYPIKQLPISISNLRHLRYLNLTHTDLETLPQSIGLLQNLHFLNLERCRFLKELPDSIGKLSDLLTLNLNYCESLVSLPTSIGNLSDLLTLNLNYCKSLASLPTSIGNLSDLLTLDLDCCESLVSLPTSLGHLKSLQTLKLGQTKIEKLPETLCCLSDLRSINLFACRSLLELPENMKDMKNLTNLEISYCDKLAGIPSGIGRLRHLRELINFVLRVKSECDLRELEGLNLGGELEISNLENVKNFQQARDANLIEKHGLESLKLSWGLDTYKRQVEASVRTEQDGQSRQDLIRALAIAEKVLEGFQPHKKLTRLSINGYFGKLFPKWLESSSSLPNLVYLSLSSCFGCKTLPEISQLHNLETLSFEKLPAVKSIPPLGHLPYLKYLTLKYLLAVKSLGSEFYGTGDDAFPVLEILGLVDMPELEEWCEASKAGQRSFPRLKSLFLINCPKLKVLPSSLPALEELYLGADYELLLSSIPSGAFPNIKNVYLANFNESRSSVPQIVAERLTFQSCRGYHPYEPMDADDELNFMRSVAGLS